MNWRQAADRLVGRARRSRSVNSSARARGARSRELGTDFRHRARRTHKLFLTQRRAASVPRPRRRQHWRRRWQWRAPVPFAGFGLSRSIALFDINCNRSLTVSGGRQGWPRKKKQRRRPRKLSQKRLSGLHGRSHEPLTSKATGLVWSRFISCSISSLVPPEMLLVGCKWALGPSSRPDRARQLRSGSGG